jgi:hypothetical protein
VRPRSPGGLIFGLIRLRSSKFIGIRINTTVQVTNVNGTRRTIIPTPENRKVGGSTRPWPPQPGCAEPKTISGSFGPNLCRLHTLLPLFGNE